MSFQQRKDIKLERHQQANKTTYHEVEAFSIKCFRFELIFQNIQKYVQIKYPNHILLHEMVQYGVWLDYSAFHDA